MNTPANRTHAIFDANGKFLDWVLEHPDGTWGMEHQGGRYSDNPSHYRDAMGAVPYDELTDAHWNAIEAEYNILN